MTLTTLKNKGSSMKNPKITGRVHFFVVAHGVICGTISFLLSTWLGKALSSADAFLPLTALFTVTFIFANAKYGPVYPNSIADLKAGLRASLTFPYLFWKDLDKRFQTPTETVYDAYVNGVHVGQLTDADYSAIKRAVLRDPRPYGAQLLNAVWVAVKALDNFVIGMPILVFWGMVVLAFVDPSVYSQILSAIQQGPDVISDAVSKYSVSVLQLWLMAVIVQGVIFMRVPGFENKFSAAMTRLLRQRLRVAAEGDVALIAQSCREHQTTLAQ